MGLVKRSDSVGGSAAIKLDHGKGLHLADNDNFLEEHMKVWQERSLGASIAWISELLFLWRISLLIQNSTVSTQNEPQEHE